MGDIVAVDLKELHLRYSTYHFLKETFKSNYEDNASANKPMHAYGNDFSQESRGLVSPIPLLAGVRLV